MSKAKCGDQPAGVTYILLLSKWFIHILSLSRNDQTMEAWSNGLVVDLTSSGMRNYDGSDGSPLTNLNAEDMEAVALH